MVGSAAGRQVAITSSEHASAQLIAKNTYGINIGGLDAPASNLLVRDYLAKFDLNIGDSQRASVRFSCTKQVEPIYPSFGATALSADADWC
jgi:hypothetical protein